jgi:hypothetical protein
VISNANSGESRPYATGSNNHENRKDRRKPAIELNEEPAVAVREMSAALQLTPQDHQLMSERGILSLQPDLRLEWRGQDRQDKTQEPDHSASLAIQLPFVRFSESMGNHDSNIVDTDSVD